AAFAPDPCADTSTPAGDAPCAALVPSPVAAMLTVTADPPDAASSAVPAPAATIATDEAEPPDAALAPDPAVAMSTALAEPASAVLLPAPAASTSTVTAEPACAVLLPAPAVTTSTSDAEPADAALLPAPTATTSTLVADPPSTYSASIPAFSRISASENGWMLTPTSWLAAARMSFATMPQTSVDAWTDVGCGPCTHRYSGFAASGGTLMSIARPAMVTLLPERVGKTSATNVSSHHTTSITPAPSALATDAT